MGGFTFSPNAYVHQANQYSNYFTAVRQAHGAIDQGFGALARASGTNVAAKLNAGAQINLGDFNNGLHTYKIFRTNYTATGAYPRVGGQGALGQFAAPANGHVTGYLGFKESIGSGNYYFGWLRVQVGADANGRPLSFSLLPIDGVVGAYVLSTDPNLASFGSEIWRPFPNRPTWQPVWRSLHLERWGSGNIAAAGKLSAERRSIAEIS